MSENDEGYKPLHVALPASEYDDFEKKINKAGKQKAEVIRALVRGYNSGEFNV